jgi:hypothetical protein
MPSVRSGSRTCSTESTTAATRPAAKTTGRPGKTTGREVISSWSLAKVTIEPAKETEPTKIVNAVATSVNLPTSPPASTISCSSSSATRAAAPPPTPLNSATICGICVIWTVRAPYTPPAVPTAIAPRISGTWSRSA